MSRSTLGSVDNQPQAEKTMEKLIEAITKEVRLHYGVDTSLPVPNALRINVEARIKAFMAVTLGICNASDVVDGMQDRLELARRQDDHLGLVGKWYEGDNAKRLGV